MNAAQDITGDVVRVRFVRLADRYAHAIDVLEAGAWRPALESIEGAASDIWPPSPPLQELHIEPREQGPLVALLVGRAGRSHWSLAVTLDPAARAIVFDAACRASAAPRRLGATYHLHDPPQPGSSGDCGRGLALEVIANLAPPQLDIAAATLTLLAGLPAPSGSHTIRWAYRVCW